MTCVDCGAPRRYAKNIRCVLCNFWRDIERKFGLLKAEYVQLLENQEGVCAICRQPETATRGGQVKMLAVDHDHRSGEVRGLLCQRCNIGLGQFQDDPELLEAAFSYMRGGTCRT